MRTILLCLALLLAGCSEGTTAVEDDPETLADDSLQATDTTGVIRGVIVDPTIAPIAGATVAIKQADVETTSAEDGSFGFSGLDPATYFLSVDKLGFKPIQTSVEVVAGVDKPPMLRIQLEPNPSEEPYYLPTQYQANLRCGLATPAVAFGCSVVRGTEDIVGEDNAEVKVFEVLPDWFQVEMIWDSTQPSGDSLLLNIAHCCDNERTGPNSTVSGPSPLTAWVVKSELHAHDDGAIAEDGVETRVFPSGNELIGDTTGERVGFVLEQDVEFFSSEFYNFKPPEGWTFVNDGPPPLPV